MNFLQPAPNIYHQWHPCPNCNTTCSMDVITRIETHDDFTNYGVLRLNRAQCIFCGEQVEAPVRVLLTLECDGMPIHECVPLVLLENPEVLDDLIHNTPPGLQRVYSNDELERSIEAFVRLEMRRQNLNPEEILAETHR